MPVRLRFRWLLIGLLLSVAGGCEARPKQYALHGQITSIYAEHAVLIVKHDDIQGFMPAMTMPYDVTEPSLITGLVAGDIIDATLNVYGSGVPKLSKITRVGHAPLDVDSPRPVVDVLQPGDVVPDNLLQDLHGGARRLSDWRNQTVAVTFMYTRCPMPDFCPLMDRQFAAVQRAVLADADLARRVRLISITLDPQHDTSSVLAAHAKQIGADPRIWTLLTGAAPEITAILGKFGVSIIHDQATPLAITHNLRTAVIDGRGRVVKIYNGQEWSPDMLLADLRDAHAR